MIDNVFNLLFRCPHRRLTRPVAPVTRVGQPHAQSYVVCLDCGKQFEYDTTAMRIGKAVDRSQEHGVLPPNMPAARDNKVKLALMAAVPAALVLGALLKPRKKEPAKPAGPEAAKPDAPKPPARHE